MRRLIRGLLRPVLWLAVLTLAGCAGHADQPVLAVGATNDPESAVLAHLYAGALRGSGALARVEIVADPIAGLDSGALTLVPGLTGRLLAIFAPDAAVRSDAQVYRTLVGALPEGIAAGDYATAAEDKPALAVTESTAAAWGGADLGVLVQHCDGLRIGSIAGDRPPPALGRCLLPQPRQFPDVAALFGALRSGQVVAAWASTADPAVPGGMVLLTDTKPALVRAENVVPLYRRHELTEPQLLAVNQVAGVLDTEALAAMRGDVAGGADPHAVVEAWLSEHPLGR